MLAATLSVFSYIIAIVFSGKIRETERRVKKPLRLFACLGIAILWFVALFGMASSRRNSLLSAPNGWLVPASDPTPFTWCPVPPGAVAIYFGTNVSWIWKFPHSLVRIREKDELVLDRDEKGRISLTVTIRDKNNNVLAVIDKNYFNTTNRVLATHQPRPDQSTLIVYDEEGNESLNARFLNPEAFRLSAVLYYPGGKISIPPPMMQQNCSYNNGKAEYNFH
jgi:hypothetical protein